MGRLKNLAKNSPAVARASTIQSFGEVASLGLAFMFSLVIGVGIGWWLDNKFGWKPYGFFGGLALGLAAAVRTAYVVLKPIVSRPKSAASAPPDSDTYDDRP